MATIVFGFSFQAEAETLPPHQRHDLGEGEAGVLFGMTTIFRLAFRSMLFEVRAFKTPAKVVQTPHGSFTVRHCASFRASMTDIHGRSAPDFLLVTILEFLPNGTATNAAEAWQSFRSVSRKTSLLEGCGLGKVLQSYSTAPGRMVGQNSFLVPEELNPEPRLLCSVFAFYFLAWLTSLRIERDQLRTELSIDPKMLPTSGWSIANQRLRILNLSRYFLTEDRTNDAALKAICNALSTKFKLQFRYARALSIHREFEHHLNNTSKLVQSQQLGSVSNLLLILTLLSVPVSFFSAAIAINLQSDIFSSPNNIISDYRVYLILLLGFLASLLPFAFLKIYDKIKRGR